MISVKDKIDVRIEHICTGTSTLESLPYLVEAQRQSDRRGERNTWVLVGSITEEIFLVNQIRFMRSKGSQEEGGDDDEDGGDWGVKCTEHIDDLSPGDDCVVITTTEHALARLMAAEGAVPAQFSNRMTFIFDMGWGNLTTKAAYAYNRVVRFVFDSSETSDHFICTISSDSTGPFNIDWTARQQDCRAILEDEAATPIVFWDETEEPGLAMDQILEDLQGGEKGRAVILIDHLDALHLEKIGPELDKHCSVLSRSDTPLITLSKLLNPSKHVMTNGAELTYLGTIADTTHVILYPMREGSVWDKETSQVVFEPGRFMRPMAELKHAMCWRGQVKPREIHYLGPSSVYDRLEDEPIDSMVYTSHFDNHVLTSLSIWPELPVASLPLKVGRNADLTEERLRRLMYKGLLEVDEKRRPASAPEGLLRCHSFLKLTLLGRTVSELVDPYVTGIDSVHAACLVGQLFMKMRTVSAAVMDAVCSLAVVLTSKSGVTYIDAVIKPKPTYREYTDNPDSVASEHCHRGPIWLAVCVWHFTLIDDRWKDATKPSIRGTEHMRESTVVSGRRMTLWYKDTFAWEAVSNRVMQLLDSCGVEVKYAEEEHNLAPEELLVVEDMLVTAFMDKLAFVFVPARDGAFGYSMTTMAELVRPSDEQMRLIDMKRCWEEDKAAVGQETPGIYCIFTHCRMDCVDGQDVTRPYDLTHVSTAAVRRALDRVDAPMIARDLFSKIETGYKVET